jgi:hypothetical protein
MVADGHAGTRRSTLLTDIGLVIASLLMFFAAASVAGLALAGTGGGIRVGANTVGALLVAVWLALAGVEMLRRRHFAFAVLTPLALAVLNLGYVLTTVRAEGLGGVVTMLIPVLLVAGSRQAFRD